MNLYNTITTDIVNICQILAIKHSWLIDNYSAISVETPKDHTHGDVCTNAAMIIASKIKQSPRVVADFIVTDLKLCSYVAEVTIAGPGFINLILQQSIWHQQLHHIIKLGDSYGDSTIGKDTKVNLEYVSTNPTGPMHIGHARGAIFGDVLAALLIKCQFKVTKEYYVNDAGRQIDVLAESVYVRYAQLCGEKIELPVNCYPGKYVVKTAKILHKQYSTELLYYTKQRWLSLIREFAVEKMLVLIKQDLADLGVEHEVFFYESHLHKSDSIEEAVKLLADKKLVYCGILEAPKGKLSKDWEEREQLLFQSTNFGDDTDRSLQKSDGSWTYFASELAYLQDKIKRGYDNLIIVLGADHGGYVKRTKAACSALSNDKCAIDIKLTQLVNFLKNGQPLKMSKRDGNFITVQDIVELVGKDAIRFMMLTHKNDTVLDFDVQHVVEQSKDNPVFYVQYAHARAYSILRNATLIAPDAIELFNKIDLVNLSLLSSPSEINLIKILSYWPKQIEVAAVSHEPHRIAFYVQAVAAQFHAFWNRGKETQAMRFIVEGNPALTAARLTLVLAMSKIIAAGLKIIGVKAIKEM